MINYEYDSKYQLRSYRVNEHGVVKYEYDARGNTIRKIQMQGNQKRQEFMYEYDSENRLIKVLHKNYKLLEKVKGTEAADIAETEIRYYYNASGMRVAVQKPNKSLISKISNSKSSIFNLQSLIKYYIYIGNNVIAEINSEGKITSEFVYGLEKICRIDYPTPVKADSLKSDNLQSLIFNFQFVYFHNNPIGSASLLTDDEGFLLQEYHYSPFGSIIFARGADGNRYRFAGKEYDIETGLYYFGARYYDPLTGRFLTKDPVSSIFDPRNLNPYIYCHNNPYRYVDPNGQFPWVVFAAVVIAGGVIGGGWGESIAKYGFDFSKWEWDWNWENAIKGMGLAAVAFVTAYYVIPAIANWIAKLTGMAVKLECAIQTASGTQIPILGYLSTPTGQVIAGIGGGWMLLGVTVDVWKEIFGIDEKSMYDKEIEDNKPKIEEITEEIEQDTTAEEEIFELPEPSKITLPENNPADDATIDLDSPSGDTALYVQTTQLYQQGPQMPLSQQVQQSTTDTLGQQSTAIFTMTTAIKNISPKRMDPMNLAGLGVLTTAAGGFTMYYASVVGSAELAPYFYWGGWAGIAVGTGLVATAAVMQALNVSPRPELKFKTEIK